MEHEIRYYLKEIERAIERGDFTPSYMVTAVKLPTGAIELAINNTEILDKINYILESYDNEMKLRTNSDVVMTNIMVV